VTFVGVAAILDLPQRGPLGSQLHHLELEQPEPAVEAQAQIQAAVAAGVFGRQAEPEGS
jgi:hypothetical protein